MPGRQDGSRPPKFDQPDQVLWALLDNAVKYGGHGEVEVEVATDEAGGRLRLTVINHGPGVSEMDRLGSSAASSAAAVNRARTGRGSGCTSRANSCARWAATSC